MQDLTHLVHSIESEEDHAYAVAKGRAGISHVIMKSDTVTHDTKPRRRSRRSSIARRASRGHRGADNDGMSLAAIKAINTDELLRATNQFHRSSRDSLDLTRPLFGVAQVPETMRDWREWVAEFRSDDDEFTFA